MEWQALSLVLLGSVLHLGWNVFAKKSKDKLAFMWLALLVPGMAGGFIFADGFIDRQFSQTAYICFAATTLVHMAYFWTLTESYRIADLSFVYPYTRGVGAMVATLLSIAFLDDNPTLIGGLGIALTICATLLEPFLSKKKQAITKTTFAFTISTASLIALYLLIDKVGVTHVPPVNYVLIMFFFMSIGFLPWMLRNQRGLREFKGSKAYFLWASFFMCSAYLAVLSAMSQSTVSYVVAARASGIVLSGIAGVIFFKESVSKIRWATIAIITTGVVLISLA
jgi:drug/metabolite transporter (DMT)-like permease